MKRIRSMIIVANVSAALALFACAEGSTKQGGGGGDGGDDGWANAASSSSSSSGSGSSSSSGSGGPTVCDTTSADCAACVTCSRESADGLCVDVFQNCVANSACVDFAGCIADCPDGDTVCTTGCEDSYPTGVPIFDVYASCVICQDCYVKCEGAEACM
ncbi:MAG: hypothetical protein IPM54_00720 [Polyangiaceae bacterium]|nr:hypothetical protein [Polyangiaceae bacterium]